MTGKEIFERTRMLPNFFEVKYPIQISFVNEIDMNELDNLINDLDTHIITEGIGNIDLYYIEDNFECGEIYIKSDLKIISEKEVNKIYTFLGQFKIFDNSTLKWVSENNTVKSLTVNPDKEKAKKIEKYFWPEIDFPDGQEIYQNKKNKLGCFSSFIFILTLITIII